MRSVFIKQGPTVFLRDVIYMEFIAVVLLFLASFAENYESLYKSFSLDLVFRYDLFIVVIASLFQVFYLVILFLNWYFSYFELRDREIIKKSGLLLHNKKSFLLSKIVSIDTRQSLLDRAINHATIILNFADDTRLYMKNVSNFRDYVFMIQDKMSRIPNNNFRLPIDQIVSRGEDYHIELKQTLRFDVRNKNVNKDLEKSVIKTIAGFLNTDGGILVIGVCDDGTPYGLENDYKDLPKKNQDGFQNHLTMLIRSYIGVVYSKYLSINFEIYKGKDVCVVYVEKSHNPVYVKNKDNTEEFFIRSNNGTQSLSMSDTQEYISSKFQNN